MKFRRSKREKEEELRAELEFHLDEEAEEIRERGVEPAAARLAARRDFGNVALVAENTRAAWGWTLVEQLAQDLRFAFRTMKANRLFTALAVASIGLGIGANTAIYSFMDAILVRALPVTDPQSLVAVYWHTPSNTVMKSMSGSTWMNDRNEEAGGILPYPAFELFRKSPLFSSVFAIYQDSRARNLNISADGRADIASGEYVSGDFFSGLGLVPAEGRFLSPADDQFGAPFVAVLSYAYSRRRFGDSGAAGRPIFVNNIPITVVGVAPPEFFGVDPAAAPDLFLPIAANAAVSARTFVNSQQRFLETNTYWIQVFARLRPGVTLPQAQAALAPVFANWVAPTARNDTDRANLPKLLLASASGGLETLRRQYSKPLFFLSAIVALILLLACANVANLLLARAAARRREIALRLSVGAGRGRILRQLLTESVLLSTVAGVVGLVFAVWSIRALTAMLSRGQDGFTLRADLNWHVLAAATALSLLVGIVFGLAPALQAARVNVIPALKEARAGDSRTHRVSLRQALVAFQIAASLVMLVAAGLFLRTLAGLRSIDLGFNPDDVLLFQVDARKAGHRDPEIAAFYGNLRQRFAEIPGVHSVSLSDDSLMQAGFGLPIGPAGAPRTKGSRILTVGPDFFTTMRVPILRGRDFTDRDRPGAPAVCILNEAYAKLEFPGRDPIGQRVTVRRGEKVERDMEVVGIVKNARYGGLTRDIPPIVYLTYDQGYPDPQQEVFALRTTGNPLGYVRAAAEILRRADPRVPMAEVRTQHADIDRDINQEIVFARLCTAFATLALVIACVGLYGAVSYSVARRTSEIGIRMALGAQRAAVVRMVLREVCLVAIIGLTIGLTAALTTARLVSSFLHGLSPNDPVALASAVIVLFAAALLAGFVPARRASRIDPMAALRHD